MRILVIALALGGLGGGYYLFATGLATQPQVSAVAPPAAPEVQTVDRSMTAPERAADDAIRPN